MAQGRVDGRVLASLGHDRRLRVPIVINLAFAHAGEDAVDCCRARGKHRSDQNGGPEEELLVRTREGRLIGELLETLGNMRMDKIWGYSPPTLEHA